MEHSRFRILVRSLSSAVCYLDIHLIDPQEGEELRGHIVGPFSERSSTVELTYPLKRKTKIWDRAEVVIPEPNFWSDSNPLEYRATLEVWISDKKVHTKTIVVQLKFES